MNEAVDSSEQERARRALRERLGLLGRREKAGGPPSWELECLKTGAAIIERRLDWSAPGQKRHRALLVGRDSVKGAREIPDEEWMNFMELIAKASGVADRLEDPRALVFRVGLCEIGGAQWKISTLPSYPEGEHAVLSVEGAFNWEAFEAWIEAAELEEGLAEAPGARPGGRL